AKVLWRKLKSTHSLDRAPLIAKLEPVARQVAERSARFFGPIALVTLDDQVSLAMALAEIGDYDSAANLCTNMLDASKDRLGECHTVRVEASNVLVESLVRQDRAVEAAELALHIIACKRRETPIVLVSELSDARPILDRGGRWAE